MSEAQLPKNSEAVRQPASVPEGGARRPSRASYFLEARRLALAFAAGLVAHLVHMSLVGTSVSAKLEPWALASFVSGILFGPVGILGVPLAYFVIQGLSDGHPGHQATMAFAYFLVGATAYVTFRFGRGLRRGLSNLRSYIAFFGAALIGSLPLALIGSSELFLKQFGLPAFWNGVAYWFSSSATTILVVGPLSLLALASVLPAWAAGRGAGERAVDSSQVRAPIERRDCMRIAFMVVGATLIAVPPSAYWPHFGSWLILLYLIPTLWASVHLGMQVALVTASASGLAYLAGTDLGAVFFSNSATHESMMSDYAELVMIAVIGAVTGAFQQAKLVAERKLRASKSELESRNNSLELVNRLADRLLSSLDVREIATETTEALVSLSDFSMVGFYLLDDPGDHLDLVAHQGFDEEALQLARRIPLEGGSNGLAITAGKVLVSESAGTDQRLLPTIRAALRRKGISTVVVIPVIFEGRALGTIDLAYRPSRNLGSEDLAPLQAIGNTVALSIVNARRLAEVHHQAHHDSLTDLPNRAELHRVFARLVAENPSTRKMALALLDLDRFKEVNDALGHQAGDGLLKQIGKRLCDPVGDREFKAFRLGGDEFSLIMPDLEDREEAEAVLGEILTSLKRPFEVGGMDLEIRSSAGLAIYPDHGADSHELLRASDVAMYEAKSSSDEVVVYSPELNHFTPERLKLASELRDAIEHDELVLHYQPKVSLDGGSTFGFEALVRWQHPDKGLLSPQSFIPIAEVGDLIFPLTDWVLDTALTQLAAWSVDHPNLSVSVNLSARSLLDATFANRLRQIIERTGVDPVQVELELTETALMSDPVASLRNLQRITDVGVQVSIDDFGTGYSSLALLKSLPIQALKIDRSFVSDLRVDDQSHAIVQATVQLARNLGIGVIAEGVEDVETASVLLEMGCTQAQGYFFSRPLPAKEIAQSLS